MSTVKKKRPVQAGRPIDCVLIASGDIVPLNTFDAAFRGGTTDRYAFQNLCPVPETVRAKGHKAECLWRKAHWGTPEELLMTVRVRQRNGRFYRFLTAETAPDRLYDQIAAGFPLLGFELVYVSDRQAESGPDAWITGPRLVWRKPWGERESMTSHSPFAGTLDDALRMAGIIS